MLADSELMSFKCLQWSTPDPSWSVKALIRFSFTLCNESWNGKCQDSIASSFLSPFLPPFLLSFLPSFFFFSITFILHSLILSFLSFEHSCSVIVNTFSLWFNVIIFIIENKNKQTNKGNMKKKPRIHHIEWLELTFCFFFLCSFVSDIQINQ